jgi:hypothetical protein
MGFDPFGKRLDEPAEQSTQFLIFVITPVGLAQQEGGKEDR